ncbi:Autophagy protein 5 [Rhodotorula toruloides]|uniref:Autophagy protein 5 n=1 Tax=Rhodotorula toruloides TaxID=5286 RepID=A0A0K3CK27_RHOTO|nr:Autophagy protein 5 [Rhodotorula toruloides]
MSRQPSYSSATSARMRQTPSNSSFTGSGGSGGTGGGDAGGAGALAAVFRTLVFGGSVPIQVVLAEDELPAQADRSIEAYYVQAPRIAYLPLLLPQIRKYFVNLVLDDNTAASLRDQDLWFEADGVPLKWHWPVGLLYDYHYLSNQPSLLPPPPSTSTADSALPSSLASVFAPLSASPAQLSFDQPESRNATLRAPSASSHAARPRTPSSARSIPTSSLPPSDPTQPWKITLHLRDPPSDVLVVSNKIEDARVGFMAMVKEADYIRSGNTKRVMNLRKERQDGLWEGVVQNNFDKYWSVGSRLVPLPSLGPHFASPASTRSPTPSSGVENRVPDANGVRSVPVKVYLPEGAQPLQELVSPLREDGTPTTLQHFLSHLLPLLFPSLSPSSAPPPALAYPLIQGIYVPLASEMGWLGACLAGADGWVSVVVVLDEREEP